MRSTGKGIKWIGIEVYVVATAILALPGVGPAARGDPPPPLFIDLGGASGEEADPIVICSRIVDVDFAVLDALQPGDIATLNLFDDASIVGLFEERITEPTGGYTWLGRLDGTNERWFVLAVVEDAVVASIDAGQDGAFSVGDGGGGLYQISEIDTADAPGCNESWLPDPSEPTIPGSGSTPSVCFGGVTPGGPGGSSGGPQ